LRYWRKGLDTGGKVQILEERLRYWRKGLDTEGKV